MSPREQYCCTVLLQSQGHHTIDRLQERGVERAREGYRQSDEHWICFKGNVGDTSETGGAHMGISKRILNGTELSRDSVFGGAAAAELDCNCCNVMKNVAMSWTLFYCFVCCCQSTQRLRVFARSCIPLCIMLPQVQPEQSVKMKKVPPPPHQPPPPCKGKGNNTKHSSIYPKQLQQQQ